MHKRFASLANFLLPTANRLASSATLINVHPFIDKEILMNIAKPIVVLALAVACALAAAGPSEPYSQSRFDQLAAAGKPTLVAVHASWCPTCKAQKPILGDLMNQPEYKDVTELVVDFDADKPTLKKYKVAMQSTLIAFKGAKEVGRSVGDTSKSSIEDLVKKTVN